MSVRESMEQHRTLAVTIALVILAGALIYIIHGATSGPPRMPNQTFYTTDDGQTIFADSVDLMPPFDHDGKTAYGVSMFTCDDGKTRFAGYLERYTSAAKSRLQTQTADFKAGKTRVPAVIAPEDIEVKKPGPGGTWINRADPHAKQITNIQCPNGGQPNIVLP